MLAPIKTEKRVVRGPSLLEFFKGASNFPAFHFLDLMTKYGDVVKCGPYFYLINHPDIAREILNRDQKDFSQQDFIGRRVTAMFGHGMVTSQGELWSSQRRLLKPVFNYKSLHSLMAKAIDEIDRSLDPWKRFADNEQKADLSDLMGTLTLMTSGRLLFNFDLSDYVSEIKKIVKTGTGYIAEGLPVYLPLWIPTASHLKIKKVSRRIDDILRLIVNESSPKEKREDDMASVLINALGQTTSSGYERRVMLDEMKTMLAGGYFPVSCSLSMIWYALGENPSHYEKMKDEIRSKPDDYKFKQNFYQDFPITTSIVFEAMRLYPVAFSIWRKAKVDFISHGYKIPKGKSICISLFNIHRHPEFWKDPNSFKSERFMDSESKERPKHHFMPFGWGNRKCIGDHYAIMVIFLTIIRTLQRYDVEIMQEPLRVRRAALICPKRVMAKISSIK